MEEISCIFLFVCSGKSTKSNWIKMKDECYRHNFYWFRIDNKHMNPDWIRR